jgi:hypothetical protein
MRATVTRGGNQQKHHHSSKSNPSLKFQLSSQLYLSCTHFTSHTSLIPHAHFAPLHSSASWQHFVLAALRPGSITPWQHCSRDLKHAQEIKGGCITARP